MNVDIRGVLNDIRAPTLVLARPDDQLVPVEAAAAWPLVLVTLNSAHCRRVLTTCLTSSTYWASRSSNSYVTTCTVAASERVLATVVFTDIVGSWLRPNPSRLLSPSDA